MRREHFVPDPGVADLRMENDLLKYELVHLQARLASLEELLAERPELEAEKLARLRAAEKDLVWLLRKLNSPPLGFIARSRAGFRSLWERWIGPEE